MCRERQIFPSHCNLTIANFVFFLLSSGRHSNMEDSSSNKPYMVTSSLNFKVTAPSFYNQPKKFASVAPPRPKSQTPPSGPSPTPVGTAVIGRVGDLPPPPPSLSDGICIIHAFSCDHFQFHLASSLTSACRCCMQSFTAHNEIDCLSWGDFSAHLLFCIQWVLVGNLLPNK